MGRRCKFYASLHRRELAKFARLGGNDDRHKGIQPANVPREIYLACTASGELCSRTYEALHSTIDYDGLWDLLEMKEVQVSWKEAAKAKAVEKADTP